MAPRWRPVAWVAAILLLPLIAFSGPLGLLASIPFYELIQRTPHHVPFQETSGPGSVVSARTMPNLLPALRRTRLHAARVEYHSVDDAGQETVVSGSVFAPRGNAPKGGWPVIGLAHGSTGINHSCAPSLHSDLLGSAALVAGYTSKGYAVALPDYQGLGASGVHPYLDNAVAGRNLIDAVRALRAVYSDASKRWLAAGISQGGGAAWSANEQAATYAPELDLVGSVSVSPDADMTSLVTSAEQGTMIPGERGVLQWFLAAYARAHPDFDLDHYRTSSVAADWTTLSECNRDDVKVRTAALQGIGPLDLRPRTVADATVLTGVLKSYALPQHPASAPMLVIYGSSDPYVDPASTTAAIARARALGDDITADLQPGRGHVDVDLSAVQPWIEQRFG